MKTILIGTAAAALTFAATRASAQSAPDQPPRSARTQVTYTGTYETQVSQPLRAPVRYILRGGASLTRQTNDRRVTGSFTLTAKFDGDSVTLVRSATGLSASRMAGVVRSGICHVTSEDQRIRYDGPCGGRGFYGRISSGPANRDQLSGTFSTNAVKIVDLDRLERERQVAGQQARLAREQESAAERARIAAMPSAGPAYATKLANLVQTDAKGWRMNRLDASSVNNVRVSAGSVKSGTFSLRADYSFNGGNQGSVTAEFSEGKFRCIRFWDDSGCRNLSDSATGGFLDGLVGVMTSSSPVSDALSPSSSTSHATEDFRAAHGYQPNQGNPPQ